MKKPKKNKINRFCAIIDKTLACLDSHHGRTVLLLTLIALVLFFNLAILSWNRKLMSQNYDYSPAQKPLPAWGKNISALLQGTPMEKMIPHIARKDKMTAAFVVSVAKKESNWGKHFPMLNGRDCYNYWGYRDQSGITTWDGYTCFKNPRQAVNVVAQRFDSLINKSGLNTPAKMVVWKCGYDCSWDNPASVQKWADDVDYYFQKVYE